MTTTTTADRGPTDRTVRPFGLRDKIGYMFGDFGNDFSFILQAFFFMVFYTNVMGINPAHVGTLLLVARLLDAFTDVGMGRIVDRIRASADGRFRPWIRRMAIPVALASSLMYLTVAQDWSYGGRVAYMTVTYLLWGSIFYTAINIPYGSMAAVISRDPADRASLSVFRSVGATLAVIFISVVVPLLIFTRRDGQSVIDGTATMWTAIGMSAFAVLFYFLCYANVRERVVARPEDEAVGAAWDAPFGRGRPGWHLECSVMSGKLLGFPFDIHTGGIDHREIHHPNEIAQNQAFCHSDASGANVWMHNNFLVERSGKMSKSAGEFLRLQLLIDKGYHPLAYRMMCLQAHYRSELEFSWEGLGAAPCDRGRPRTARCGR